MKRVKLYALFIILLSIICISNVDAKVITEKVKGKYYYDQAFKQLAELNKERAKVGAEPLKMDKELFAAAQTRAAEITLVFAHIRPSGKEINTVSNKIIGENILFDSRAGSKYATKGWMNSTGHRKNMLSKDYKSVGIGCFKYNNKYYWVQVFDVNETDNELKTAPKNVTKTVAVEVGEIPDKVAFESDVYYIDNVGDSIIIKFNTEPANIRAEYIISSRYADIDVELAKEGIKVTANELGVAQIRVAYSEDVYDIANIIIGKRPESISLDKNYYEVEVGKYFELAPTITPDDCVKGYYVVPKEKEYFNKIESDEENEEIVRLYGAKTGTTEVTVMTVDKKYAFTATVKIIPSTTIDSISLDKTSVKIARGASTNLVADIYPMETILDKTITWTSSNPEIASVDQTGKITAINVGVATITATASNGLKATATITIDKVDVKNLNIAAISKQIYTGKSLKPNINIKDNDKVLELNKDYKLSYKNNKNIGTATVTIKGIGEYKGTTTKTFKIVVGKPNNLSVSKQGKSSITIKWSKSGNVTGYEVYYSTKKDKGFKKATTITKSSKLSYKKTKLSSGKTYYFKVRAYKTISGKKKYSSYTIVMSATTAPKNPSIKFTSNTSEVKVKWSKISGASGYEIYRSTDKKNYTKIATTTSTSYLDTNLSSAKTYYYKVRTYRNFNNKKINSSYSKVVSVTTKPTTPEVTSKAATTSITLNISKVSRASGYEIYMATSKTGKYKKIKTTKSTSYKKTSLKDNKIYYFKVRAYKSVSGKKVYSSYKMLSIKTLAKPNFKRDINKVKLNPIITNYEVLDNKIEKIINDTTNSKMTNYEKLVAVYNYVIKKLYYNGGVVDPIKVEDIAWNSHIARQDAYIAYFADEALTDGYGVCDYYAALFVVLARRLGFDAYTVSGSIKYNGSTNEHTWAAINTGGTYYYFDPQAEDQNNSNLKSFGRPKSTMGSYKFDLKTNINSFNKFQIIKELKTKATVTGATDGDVTFDLKRDDRIYGNYDAHITIVRGQTITFNLAFEGEAPYYYYISISDGKDNGRGTTITGTTSDNSITIDYKAEYKSFDSIYIRVEDKFGNTIIGNIGVSFEEE